MGSELRSRGLKEPGPLNVAERDGESRATGPLVSSLVPATQSLQMSRLSHRILSTSHQRKQTSVPELNQRGAVSPTGPPEVSHCRGMSDGQRCGDRIRPPGGAA